MVTSTKVGNHHVSRVGMTTKDICGDTMDREVNVVKRRYPGILSVSNQ